MADMKRTRTIIGVAFDPPHPCPCCSKPSDVFERVDVDGKVVLICPSCMDRVIEEVQKQMEEEETHAGPDD